jgi:hypothetical protein
MRAAIQRLSTQHSYLSGLKCGAVSFESAKPCDVAALSKRPATAGARFQSETAYTASRSALNLTRVSRQDFDHVRPQSALPGSLAMVQQTGSNSPGFSSPHARSSTGHAQGSPKFGSGPVVSTRRKPASGSRRPSKQVVNKITPQNCSSEFMRKLTLQQQIASVDRLSNSHRQFLTDNKQTAPAATKLGGRSMNRTLSVWERPADQVPSPKNEVAEGRRKSGKHYSATASMKYRTVTGKVVSADRIEHASRRMSTAGH